MSQLDEDVEVLVGQYVEQANNADLTQVLLQVRARRRSRTVTARRQTDRLAGRTYVNAAVRAPNANATARVTNATTSASDSAQSSNNVARDDRARRRASRRH